MKWFIPSWNGDLRLEPDPNDDTKTLLHIVNPTENEKKILSALTVAFNSRSWLDEETSLLTLPRLWKKKKVSINASVADVGPVVVAIMKPGPAVLTAVRFKNGSIETCETHVAGKDPPTPYRDPAESPALVEPSEEVKALAKKEDATAAATVSRPTPSCPDCYVDATKPATEVLLSFLDEEQHESWKNDRFVMCQGGLSGHRYLLAHRHSPRATRQSRICFDLDDKAILHFHDWSVPPEEEVLAAMLILSHKEPWLRNEATCLGGNFECVFKNPFGDSGDGVADATFTRSLGTLMQMAVSQP